MAKISKFRQVTDLLAKVAANNQLLRAQLVAGEEEEKKLRITAEVLGNLDADDSSSEPISEQKSGAMSLVDARLAPRMFVAASAAKPKGGIRAAIVATFASGKSQTAGDVVKKLEGAGHSPNASTVASTLSKLVSEGALTKAGQSNYLLKGETPL
jgi:hypothetical protein